MQLCQLNRNKFFSSFVMELYVLAVFKEGQARPIEDFFCINQQKILLCKYLTTLRVQSYGHKIHVFCTTWNVNLLQKKTKQGYVDTYVDIFIFLIRLYLPGDITITSINQSSTAADSFTKDRLLPKSLNASHIIICKTNPCKCEVKCCSKINMKDNMLILLGMS